MQISLEEILERNYGVQKVFGDNGELTPEGLDAYNKMIALVADVGDFFNTNIENWIATFDSVLDESKGQDWARENDENKIFTFRFYFRNYDGGLDEIEFCAESIVQAKCLFTEWAEEQKAETDFEPKHYGWRVAFNLDDLNEYGDRYGNPDEYELLETKWQIREGNALNI